MNMCPGRPRKQHLTCFKCFLQFLATWEVTTGVWGCVHVSMTISFKGSTASLMKHGIWERIWRHLHLILSREQAMFSYGGVLKYGYPQTIGFPIPMTWMILAISILRNLQIPYWMRSLEVNCVRPLVERHVCLDEGGVASPVSHTENYIHWKYTMGLPEIRYHQKSHSSY